MRRKRSVYVGATVLALIVAVGVGASVRARAAAQTAKKPAAAETAKKPAGGIPVLEVDPWWPKPLPNHWRLGQVSGVGVDEQDHVWIVNRPGSLVDRELAREVGFKSPAGWTQPPPTAECCIKAPPIIEFSPDGTVLSSWGGPGKGFEWPNSEHGLDTDYKGNVWTGGENQYLKFSRDGKFLLQIGKKGQSKGNTDTANLNRPTGVAVDPKTNEVFIADGYGNHRIIVFDADTGAYKRQWGAYGKKTDDIVQKGPWNPKAPPPERFGNDTNGVHCIRMANDGLLYVCDREMHRVQVFHKDGTFVKEAFVATNPGDGQSVWDIAFSPDPAQTFLYSADGWNEKVWILRRDTLEVVGSFGRGGGHYAGQFFAAHSMAADSKGNVYVGEVHQGKRVQKFVPK